MAPRDDRRSWTVLADVVAALRKRWERGELLSALASGEPWEPLSVPLRGPTAGETGERFEQVREWVRGWQAIPAAKARVEFAAIGGRAIDCLRRISTLLTEQGRFGAAEAKLTCYSGVGFNEPL